MTKYIDADALCKGRVSNDPVLIAVKCEPAADVAEVVHGEWLNFVGDYVTAECSVCGECYDPSDFNDKEHFDMFKQLYKYCPNCGAKMDLPFVPLERCPGDVCRGVDRSVEAGKVGV